MTTSSYTVLKRVQDLDSDSGVCDMAGYYLGIDQGTTLTTAVLMDTAFRVAAKASVPHANRYPQPGWVEQDPEEIFKNVLQATQTALAQIPGAEPSDILGIGLDHQGETCLIWDSETGHPVYPAIVWQDRRTAKEAAALKEAEGGTISRLTGLTPDAYYSATKIAWILDHTFEGRERVASGRYLIGTLNTYIFWCLSGGSIYKTDPASASCMMLMDLTKTVWDPALVQKLLGISADHLPEICDNSSLYGYTDPDVFLGIRIPIGGSSADSMAAIIGGGCLGSGILKTSYGTGNFMSLQIGKVPVFSEFGAVTDCVYREAGDTYYRFRGACYTAGAAVEWLKNGIGIIEDPKETAAIAGSVPDSGGVFFVPAFSGLATPYWDPYARGAFHGISGGTERAHLVRAVLEAVAYQVTDCYRALSGEIQEESLLMRADGGMVDNPFLMQLQADMLGFPVEVPAEKESAAYGAACLAAHADGHLDSVFSVRDFVEIKCVYEPVMSADERETRLAGYRKAVQRSLRWID